MSSDRKIRTPKFSRGFTLLELVIVMAVIAILTTIAYPAFVDQLRRSRRSEAISGLQQIQLLQEKYRTNHVAYGSLAEIAGMSTSEHAYYAFSVSGQNAAGFTATATTQGAQSSDSKCATFTLTYASGTTTKASTPAGNTCW